MRSGPDRVHAPVGFFLAVAVLSLGIGLVWHKGYIRVFAPARQRAQCVTLTLFRNEPVYLDWRQNN